MLYYFMIERKREVGREREETARRKIPRVTVEVFLLVSISELTQPGWGEVSKRGGCITVWEKKWPLSVLCYDLEASEERLSRHAL